MTHVYTIEKLVSETNVTIVRDDGLTQTCHIEIVPFIMSMMDQGLCDKATVAA